MTPLHYPARCRRCGFRWQQEQRHTELCPSCGAHDTTVSDTDPLPPRTASDPTLPAVRIEEVKP